MLGVIESLHVHALRPKPFGEIGWYRFPVKQRSRVLYRRNYAWNFPLAGLCGWRGLVEGSQFAPDCAVGRCEEIASRAIFGHRSGREDGTAS
jgi:hypothetical protein